MTCQLVNVFFFCLFFSYKKSGRAYQTVNVIKGAQSLFIIIIISIIIIIIVAIKYPDIVQFYVKCAKPTFTLTRDVVVLTSNAAKSLIQSAFSIQ